MQLRSASLPPMRQPSRLHPRVCTAPAGQEAPVSPIQCTLHDRGKASMVGRTVDQIDPTITTKG
jgi:hypothetical protein